MIHIDTIHTGDCLDYLRNLPEASVDCCVTSPPYYGLRDYGVAGQIGLEETPEVFIERLVAVFREVRRILKPDGTLWVNIGDSYAGGSGRWGGDKNMSKKQTSSAGSLSQIPVAKKWQHDTIKPKDLIGIPWMLAFALRADGWCLRQDIIWSKPNPMPESVSDRCTKAHEYIFLLSKSPRYHFDNDAIKEQSRGWNGSRFEDGKNLINHPNVGKNRQKKPTGWEDTGQGGHGSFHRDGRAKEIEYTNGIPEKKSKRSVWTVAPNPFKEAHFATFPEDLIVPCILAGCREGGVVLDPFMGAGTTAIVARKLNRHFAGCDLNPEYVAIAEKRLKNEIGLFL